MKYIGYWEFEPKDVEAVIKKYYMFKKLVEKPGMKGYPNPTSTSYQVGEMNGFQLFEAEYESQLANLMAFYRPEMRWEFTPIISTKESINAHFFAGNTAHRAEMWKEIEEKLDKKRKEIENSAGSTAHRAAGMKKEIEEKLEKKRKELDK